MEKFMETFYGILFHPVETFRNFQCQNSYKLPLITVCIISLFLFLLKNPGLQFTFGTLLNIVTNTFGLIFSWIFFAFFIDLIARIFQQESKYTRLLTLTAFALVPWIFIAPMKLLKNINEYTSTLGSILLIGIFIWTITLQILAVSETYQIPRKNAIMIIFVPFLGGLLNIFLITDFFSKLIQFSTL